MSNNILSDLAMSSTRVSGQSGAPAALVLLHQGITGASGLYGTKFSASSLGSVCVLIERKKRRHTSH